MDQKQCEIKVVDHLSRLEGEQSVKDKLDIVDSFPDEKILAAVLKKYLCMLTLQTMC